MFGQLSVDDGEGKGGGEGWEGEWGWVGVAEKESGLLNVTQGRTAGGGGWGGLGGQAYRRVCEDRGEKSGCKNHTRMDK